MLKKNLLMNKIRDVSAVSCLDHQSYLPICCATTILNKMNVYVKCLLRNFKWRLKESLGCARTKINRIYWENGSQEGVLPQCILHNMVLPKLRFNSCIISHIIWIQGKYLTGLCFVFRFILFKHLERKLVKRWRILQNHPHPLKYDLTTISNIISIKSGYYPYTEWMPSLRIICRRGSANVRARKF